MNFTTNISDIAWIYYLLNDEGGTLQLGPLRPEVSNILEQCNGVLYAPRTTKKPYTISQNVHYAFINGFAAFDNECEMIVFKFMYLSLNLKPLKPQFMPKVA